MKILKNPSNNRIAKVWTDDLRNVESVALDQIRLMLELPGLFNHIAIMPDTHLGKGAVVGGVVATDEVVVPNIVGVDIGCGMSAYQTNIKLQTEMDKDFWRQWKGLVDREVPTGFQVHKTPQKLGTLERELSHPNLTQIMQNKAALQLGTLGGGNHFLEAQVDEEGYVWFMVHSGSRNTGLQIATFHNKKAKEFNQKYFSKVPDDLWFLRLDDVTGHNYFEDMKWATEFALESRWRMLEAMVNSFMQMCKLIKRDVRGEGINIHHNFANIENHFGQNVVIHRKGATQAKKDQIGIIPGSMGTPSYIVKGLGNEESYTSCSHGAGRRMSRSQAKREFTSSDLQKALEETYTAPSTNFIDEAPGAYKDIDQVIANQTDLVEVLHKLKPIITIKGGGRDEG